jgi:hypothetical protein
MLIEWCVWDAQGTHDDDVAPLVEGSGGGRWHGGVMAGEHACV